LGLEKSGSISEKSMTYSFRIHFKNKKIHEMQKIFHEMDFRRPEMEVSEILGVLKDTFRGR